MKEGWKMVRLDSVSNIIGGGTPSKKNEDYFSGDIPWATVRDMRSDIISKTEHSITKLGLSESSSNIIPSGNVVIATRVGLGKICFIEKDTAINQDLKGIIPKNGKVIPQFLFWWFKSVSDEIINAGTGATVQGVKLPFIKSLLIPNIPLPEQKQIVALLDQAFAAIDQAKANIEKNIENAKELFQSKLNEIFSQTGEGWEETTIGDIGKVSMCKRILKSQTLTEGDIPFYKIGTFGKTPNAFISNELYQEYKTKYSFPKKGDILISASGTIGRRVVYDGEPGFFQDSNIVWINNYEDKVTNEYLYQFYGVCDWNPSKGATISRLYNDDLRRIKISFPSIEVQNKLVAIMKGLDLQTQKIQKLNVQKLESLDELKKSILQKAFSGELVLNPDLKDLQIS